MAVADDDFVYVDERSIDPELKCSICHSPFNNPNRTLCNHTYCRECITNCFGSNSVCSCPVCRRSIRLIDLKSAEDISNAVKRLRVTCRKCGYSGLFRAQFDDHIRNSCSETHSNSSQSTNNAVNLDHPIINNDRIESLINQPLRQIQRFKEELQGQRATINNNNDQTNNNINTINGKLKQQQDEIETLRKSNVTQEKKVQELQSYIQRQKTKIGKLENSIEQLEKDKSCLQNQISRSNDDFDKYESSIRNLEEKLKQLIPYKNDELEDHITKKCQFGSEFTLRKVDLIDRDMEIIVKRVIINRQCSSLDLRKNKITYQGASILADVFHRNIRLKILDLSYNDIHNRGIQYLAEALFENTTLKELSLGSTEITNQGIKYLNEMLQINQTLKKLELYENNFNDDGMILLANVLSRHNRTLKELSLHSNKSITDKSIYSIIDMFRENQSLDRIELDQCDFSNGVKTRIRDAAENSSISIKT